MGPQAGSLHKAPYPRSEDSEREVQILFQLHALVLH